MNIFDPNTDIKSITIVGVGGTGAQVARTVGRIAYDMQRSRRHAPEIVLIDPDTIFDLGCYPVLHIRLFAADFP